MLRVSNQLLPAKSFFPQGGSGYVLPGQQGAGIGKSKVRKAVKATKKAAPKVARATMNLLEEFGTQDTKDKVGQARRAEAIIRGSGHCAKKPVPAAALRAMMK